LSASRLRSEAKNLRLRKRKRSEEEIPKALKKEDVFSRLTNINNFTGVSRRNHLDTRAEAFEARTLQRSARRLFLAWKDLWQQRKQRLEAFNVN
jgi:hypothetical protein